MKNSTYRIIFFFITILYTGIFVQAKNLYGPRKSILYRIKANDNIDSIVEEIYPNFIQGRFEKEEYKSLIIKWNPQINDWRKLSVNKRIFIDFPFSPFMWNDSKEIIEETYNDIHFAIKFGASKANSTESFPGQSKISNKFEETASFMGSMIFQHTDTYVHQYRSDLQYIGQSKASVTSSTAKVDNKSHTAIGLEYRLLSSRLSFLGGGFSYEENSILNIDRLEFGDTEEFRKVSFQNLRISGGIGMHAWRTSFFQLSLLLNKSFSSKVISSSISGSLLEYDLFSAQVSLEYRYKNKYLYDLSYKMKKITGTNSNNSGEIISTHDELSLMLGALF
jgi:hypothetical protein